MKRYLPLFAGLIIGAIVTVLVVEGYHAFSSPRLCIACHSMAGDGSAWKMSNHKQFACIECHMPDSGALTRVSYKVEAGLHDLWHETLKDYPAFIALSPKGKKIAQGNCVRCHRSTIERVAAFSGQWPRCSQCHRRIVHGSMTKTGE
jgi:cytochrome c nitrite reductase small subunit